MSRCLPPLALTALALLVAGCGSSGRSDPQARAAAEWALSRGGRVRLIGSPEWFVSAAALPQEDFGLEEIDLNKPDATPNPIREKELAVLDGLTNLRVLGLYGAEIGDAAAERLSSLKTLEQLELSQTRVTDQAFDHLASLPELEKLFLRGTGGRVTDAGVEAFKQRRPKATVYR